MPIHLPFSLAEHSRIVVASGNAGKVREIRAILAEHTRAEVASPAAATVVYPDEGDDYEVNAIGKAEAVAAQLAVVALGDDSGLEVDALGGRPGAKSARYGGPGLGDRGRVELLLRELQDTPAAKRTARFVCQVALAFPDGRCFVAFGECRGRILETPRGQSGFGYDPVFEPLGLSRALAELGEGEKNRVSHRAGALRSLFEGGARVR